MFEEIIRALKNLQGPREISVSVSLDENGYYDRVCPSSECGGHFKVLYDDWKDKVTDECVFCPFCRYQATSDNWDTDEQREYHESAAFAEMSQHIDDAFAQAVRKTPQKRIGSGPLKISMSLTYKPGQVPVVIPATATEELRQDFSCEACDCRFASLGSSFFCPACGHNSAVTSFDNTIITVQKTISALPSMRQAMEQAADADTAKDAIRQIVEDQFGRLVGAFERLNEALFDALPYAAVFDRRGSVFQRIDDASALWLRASGKGYGDFLDTLEFQRLKLLIQRRHVLSHRQGIVDQVYIDKSGDSSYSVGQRLVVRDADVIELTELLARIAAGLQKLA